MYYLYIIQCNDGSLYTGITTDVKKRFVLHKAGKGAKYTRARGVAKLLFTERHENRSTASKREAEIKKWKRKQKLDFLSSKARRLL